MLLEIDTHSGVPIYRQVVDQVRGQILTGRAVEGEGLESVRDLAARLKVNPMTISKAYSLLEAEGLVERRRGVGLFVCRVRADQKRRSKARLLEGVLKKAAVLAAQMGIAEAEATEIFGKAYRESNSGKEETTNEWESLCK